MYMINKFYVNRIKLYFLNYSMYVIVYINYLLFEWWKFGVMVGE